jgi:hypothetical protein
MFGNGSYQNVHSLDASYQVSVHLAEGFQRRKLKAHFDMIHYQTWPPQAILVSEWLICFKFSSLKPLVQMNRNLVGSIYGMSSEDCSFRPDRKEMIF